MERAWKRPELTFGYQGNSRTDPPFQQQDLYFIAKVALGSRQEEPCAFPLWNQRGDEDKMGFFNEATGHR